MPHLLPATPHRRPARMALAMAVAGMLTLAAALTACTNAAQHPQAVVAATNVVQLTGAGSMFDAPFFSLAFPAYQQAHPGVAVSYTAVGSSAGITGSPPGR